MIFQEPDDWRSIRSSRSATRSPKRSVRHESVDRADGARAGAGDARARAASRRRRGASSLSARTVGRHAAARDDRARARLRPKAAARRRADDRARRDGADPDPAAVARAAAGDSAWRSIFVTHDIGVAVEVADRIAVMYAGRIVEEDAVAGLVGRPRTRTRAGLLASTVADAHARPAARDHPGRAARPGGAAGGLRVRAALRRRRSRVAEASCHRSCAMAPRAIACWRPRVRPDADENDGRPAAPARRS